MYRTSNMRVQPFKRIVVRLLIVALFLPGLAGCWDNLDIESRATVLGLAIDSADPESEQEDNITHNESFTEPDTEMIEVTAQIAVPGRVPLGPMEGGGGGGADTETVWVLSAVGHTLDDALSNLQQEVAEHLFLGHLRIVVISEELAKQGVKRFNDYFRRNPELRRTAWMSVSKEKASAYMDINPQLEVVPSLYLSNMVEHSVDVGKFPSDTIGLFWRMISSKGQDGYLPYLEIREKDNVQLQGLAYFKGERMVGYIEPLDIDIYMAITGHRQGGSGAVVPIPGKDAKILEEAIQRRNNIKTSIEHGKPKIEVKIRYEVEINEKIVENTDVDLDNPKVIEKINKAGEKLVVQSAELLIEETQAAGSDIFGFGEYIRAKHPGYWNKNIGTEKKWRELYKDINVDVDCSYNIRRVGMKAR